MHEDFVDLASRVLGSFRCDVHKYFRERGLALRSDIAAGNYDSETATKPPSDLLRSDGYDAALLLGHWTKRHGWRDVLSHEQSDRLLWGMYLTTPPRGHSLLCELIPSLEAIRPIYRNGLNIYKLSGWVVHVLMGYTFLAQHARRASLPATVRSSEALVAFMGTLNGWLSGLSPLTREILPFAYLGHDIGVRTAIPNHDLHGLPYVPSFLAELQVPSNDGGSVSRDASYLSWTSLVVRFHALVNRIGVELSLRRVWGDLSNFMTAIPTEGPLENAIRSDLPSVLAVVGTADVFAVNDDLLTDYKAACIVEGHQRLQRVLALGWSPTSARDLAAEGLARLRHFLPNPADIQQIGDVSAPLGVSAAEAVAFAEAFASLGEVDFGLSLLPRLRSNSEALAILSRLAQELRVHGHSDYTDCSIAFSPQIQAEHVSEYVNSDSLHSESARRLTIRYDRRGNGGCATLSLSTEG